MNKPLSAATAALLLMTLALPALASGSASSASSQAGSASVGSVSASFEKSSDSSAGDRSAAAGDYRLVEVAQAPNRPGTARLRLQALAEGHAEFYLYVPQQVAEQSQLAAGTLVSVKERDYGFEFAKHASQEAFFLVLADGWLREMQTKVVTL